MQGSVTVLARGLVLLLMVLTAEATKRGIESQHSPPEVHGVDVTDGDLWRYTASAMRGLNSGDYRDSLTDAGAGAVLLQEGSRTVVFGSDPIIGFMILTAIVLAALVAWLTYHLILFAGSSSRKLTELAPGMSLDTTVAVLKCLTEAEMRLSCLACIASATNPDSCG